MLCDTVAGEMSTRAFETSLRVIYGDTDQMGVVYYANYFRYFEAGRTEFFRSCGGTYLELEKTGFGLPVIEAHCDYKVSAKFDDLVVVKTWVDELRRASLRFGYEARRHRDDVTLATGHTWHACVAASGKPARLPPAVVRLLTGDP
jgi:acyl-CoA thioester hydrolase